MKKSITAVSRKNVSSEGHLLSGGHLIAKKMTIMKVPRKMSRLLIAALLLVPYIAGIPFGQSFAPKVFAQSNAASKISVDLRDKLSHSGPQDRVQVIIQTPAAASSGLLKAARSANGIVSRSYANINALALELPASAVAALANRPDVRYVSADRTTKATGHLETTT